MGLILDDWRYPEVPHQAPTRHCQVAGRLPGRPLEAQRALAETDRGQGVGVAEVPEIQRQIQGLCAFDRGSIQGSIIQWHPWNCLGGPPYTNQD